MLTYKLRIQHKEETTLPPLWGVRIQKLQWMKTFCPLSLLTQTWQHLQLNQQTTKVRYAGLWRLCPGVEICSSQLPVNRVNKYVYREPHHCVLSQPVSLIISRDFVDFISLCLPSIHIHIRGRLFFWGAKTSLWWSFYCFLFTLPSVQSSESIHQHKVSHFHYLW